MAFLYVLQSESTGRFYVGSTTHLGRRLSEHARGQTPSTRKRGPWKLAFHQKFPNLSEARQQERRLKAWKSHAAIAKFVGMEAAKG
ncbi:GIY-YIG nuclease family protein [Acidobacteriia bacterium AH_259_A11_L15]|nr:GIY-YIG nuclease family protein [Acidobacteriia bacterium AH_259_A11_L15]